MPINPQPCGLEWASGTVPIPNGRIDVEWELKGNLLDLNVFIPSGIEYEVKLPENIRESNIFINGIRKIN